MEGWVVIGWDSSRHNSAELIHTGNMEHCKRLEREFLLKHPRGWEAVAMSELEWQRILAADERGS